MILKSLARVKILLVYKNMACIKNNEGAMGFYIFLSPPYGK